MLKNTKYLIEFQPEDEGPQTEIISGKNEENAIENLKEKLIKDWDIDKSELGEITILDIRKI